MTGQDLLTKDLFLSISILGRRDSESLFERRTEPVVSLEADLGGNLVDCVVGFFKKLFGLLETELQAVLVRTSLEQLTKAALQLEFVDASPVG